MTGGPPDWNKLAVPSVPVKRRKATLAEIRAGQASPLTQAARERMQQPPAGGIRSAINLDDVIRAPKRGK